MKANPTDAGNRGRIGELFGNPRWRRNVFVGLGLSVAGVFGLWGVGFWSGELIDSTLPTMPLATRTVIQRIVATQSSAEQASLVNKLDPGQMRSYVNLYKYTMPSGKKFDPAVAKSESLTDTQKQKMTKLLDKSLEPKEEPKIKRKGFILQQVGGFFGILFMSWVAGRFGRSA